MLKRFPSPAGERLRFAGFASLLREVPALIASAPSPFVLFLAADRTAATDQEWGDVARALLDAGLAYLVAWGPGCRQVEDAFDLVFVEASDIEGRIPNAAEGVLMTTSHANQELEEALWFGIHAAHPDEGYVRECPSTIAVAVERVDWHERMDKYLAAGAPLIDAA